MISRILFHRAKVRMVSAAAVSLDMNKNYNFDYYDSDKTLDVICEKPCIYQPILSGNWEDSIGMFRVEIIPAKKHRGYHVIDNFYKKIHNFDSTFLDYMNDETTNITFSAPWGPNETIRYYSGCVSPNGEKIIWFGDKSNVEWFKIM